MDDLDYEKLDPGIRRVVALLRAHNFHTVDSGDGVTKFLPESPFYVADPDSVNPFPHVACMVDPEQMVSEARRLKTLLAGHGVAVAPMGNDKPSIHASYDPADETALLILVSVEDTDLSLPD